MNFFVFSQLARNFWFPFFIDSKNSETSSHLTLPSSRESCKLHFMSPGLAHRSEADFSRGLGRGTSATGTDQLFPRTGLAHLRCREH